MNPSAVAAGLLTLAAAGAVLVVAREWSQPADAFSQERVCLALAAVQGDVRSPLLGDQLSLRARAARLADSLSAGAQRDAPPESARRIILVLQDSRASLADLAEAVEPVAAQCP